MQIKKIMNTKQRSLIFLKASVATLSLLLLYFVIVTLISGFEFALSQFTGYWYFLGGLALGFGIQIGLYSYLKQLVKISGAAMSGKTVAERMKSSVFGYFSIFQRIFKNFLRTGVLKNKS